MIDQLRELFDDLSALHHDDCLIDLEEFGAALGLKSSCVILKRIFARFDRTKTSTLNFREFVVSLSDLSLAATRKEKVKFSFELYDLNRDGTIDLSELKQLLRAALANAQHSLNLTEEQMVDICENTLRDLDKDGNGVIDFEEYESMVEEHDRILDVFTIDIEKVLSLRKSQRDGEMQSCTKEEEFLQRSSPTNLTPIAGHKSPKKKGFAKGFACGSRKPKRIEAVPVNDVENLF